MTITTCPTCGAQVKVEGNTTLYYVPDKTELEAIRADNDMLRDLHLEASGLATNRQQELHELEKKISKLENELKERGMR